MASQIDVKQIDTAGKISPKKRFDDRDWTYIAEWAVDEYNRRKGKREDREKCWKDIDRQIAMEPDLSHKRLSNGGNDPDKSWMAEMELPLQAQALEILTADARRLGFPENGSFFRAHAETTDEYLSMVDFKSFIKGDELEVPSQINQDNADKLVEGFLMNMFRQNDFVTRVDKINAGAFSYGMGVGRARKETKNIYIHESRGVRKEKQRIPVLVPCSIKNIYLEDALPSMHSAQVLGDTIIAEDNIKFENIQLAANRGSSDPDDEDGGWMPANLKKVEPDSNGYVKVLEIEGDIVVPRKTVRSLVIPGAIATIVIGSADKAGNAGKAVIRFRFRKAPYSSYLLFPYHYENADEIYPTGPLMKGRPIQILATDALNRLMDSGALKNRPPIGWDRNDLAFAATGGPIIAPGKMWGTTELQSIKVFNEIGGEPAALAGILTMAIKFYAELTGVLPGRLGAQTVSHTTAFAKDAELQRGAVRTVDYVNQVGQGPMVRWLDMAYQMGRDELEDEKVSFYIDAYGGFVEVTKDHLPDQASFEWLGAGGPADAVQKMQLRLNALQIGIKMDQLGVSLGKTPRINLDAAIDQTLREGGWVDIDAIVNAEPPAGAGVGERAAAAAVTGLPQNIRTAVGS